MVISDLLHVWIPIFGLCHSNHHLLGNYNLAMLLSPVCRGKLILVHFINNSMTSLFAHNVAQPTKWRFLPKNLSQLAIFVIGLALP